MTEVPTNQAPRLSNDHINDISRIWNSASCCAPVSGSHEQTHRFSLFHDNV
jgi:hypothetical protein